MSLTWSSRKTVWLLLVVAVVGAALLVLMLPIRASNLATGQAGWIIQGCFAQGSVYPSTRVATEITAHELHGVTLWGSYCGSDASTGELRSPVFKAPAILELFLAGYVGKPSLTLYLEREDNHERMPLSVVRQPDETWDKLRWWTDVAVRGQEVRLIAIDHEVDRGGWLGVSNPRQFTVASFLRQQVKSWSRTTGDYLFQLALFLLPGFAVASALTAKSRRPVAPIHLVIVVIVTGATLGYLSFWAFFFAKGLGRLFSYAVYLAALCLLVFPSLRPRAVIIKTARLIGEPFLYATLAGLCYINFYFIFGDPFTPGIGYAGDRFFAEMLPGDNVIPEIFADRIYDRKPVRPFCCGDWLSSDRPPLQTGVVLMERPLRVLRDAELNYELLSSALQCFWICGAWCLLKSIGTDRVQVGQVIGFLIFSGFLFYNSVYTWPKLLAASCILFLLSILFDVVRSKRLLTYFETTLAATCLGLALMAHPGSTFSLPVFGILLLRFRRLFALRQVAMALVIVIGFYLPWSSYQRFVDPPGNRLLKMHLGGIVPVDSRTTWEGIRDSYQTHTLSEIVRYKWSNLVFLGGQKFFDSYGLTDFTGGHIDRAATEESRRAQRFFMWNAVGLVNVGWLAGLFLLVKRRRQWSGLAVPFSGWLVGAALVNMVFWSLVTFGPNETQTAHSSYADILLLSIGLLSFILTLPRIFYPLLFAWQLFNYFVVWVWAFPERIAQPTVLQWPMMVAGIGLTVMLVWRTVRPDRSATKLDGPEHWLTESSATAGAESTRL